MTTTLKTAGFHHITMVSKDARRTLDFYGNLLGLGLVKKTVNFDDPGAYHLYFGDDGGRPGTRDSDRGRRSWSVRCLAGGTPSGSCRRAAGSPSAIRSPRTRGPGGRSW